jgi:hypothetical protein
MMTSLSQASGGTNSEWEEGILVIQDILRPGSSAYEAMTPEQRVGLANVQKILIGAGGQDEAAAHLPRRLRMSASGPGSGIDAYLLSQFAGVKRNNAKQKLKNIVNANIFISGLKTLTSSRDITNVVTSVLWSFVPPEFEELDVDTKKEVLEILSPESLANWGFDVFKLDELTKGNALLFAGWGILGMPYSQYAMKNNIETVEVNLDEADSIPGYKFLEEFEIHPGTMVNFLRAVQDEYQDNPYHNSIHAADVTQSLHSMLVMGGDKFAEAEIQLFGVLLAAVVHDMGHPGKNNNFQVQTKSEIALQYNDHSVLEHMHVSKAFTRIFGGKGDATVNIFKRMKPKQYASVRSMIIECVLHTDMTKHFSSVNLLKGILLSTPAEEVYKSDHALTVLHFLLHLADISNPAKPHPLFELWTDRCLTEFFDQGDEEKKLGLTVSPLCDRKSTDRASSQIGFIQYVVLPAFIVTAKCVPKMVGEIIPVIEGNLQFWREEKDRSAVHDSFEEEE